MTLNHLHVLEIFLAGQAGQTILSSAVQALPEPTPQSSPVYLFAYKFAHLIGANWKQYQAAGKFPDGGQAK